MNELVSEPPLRAQASLVGGAVEVRAHLDHPSRLDLQVELAATAAIRANGRDRLQCACSLRPAWKPFDKRARRAVGNALAAGDAGRSAKRPAVVDDDEAPVPTLRDPQDMMALDLAARPHAAPAKDASIQIKPDEGMRIVDGKRSPVSVKAAAGQIVTTGQEVQLTATAPLIGDAIGRMVSQ